MVEAAARRVQDARLRNVRTAMVSGATFDFPDNSFDAGHTERVLMAIYVDTATKSIVDVVVQPRFAPGSPTDARRALSTQKWCGDIDLGEG